MPLDEESSSTTDTTTTPEETAVTTPTDPTPETPAAEATATVEESTGTPPETDPPKFAPNYQLEVMDQKVEVPAWLRPLMTTPEAEKQVREFCNKAFGLDFVNGKHEKLKGTHEETRTNFEKVSQQFGALEEDVSKVMLLKHNKDYDAFFQVLDIPEKDVLEWAYEKVRESEMSEMDRSRVREQKSFRTRAINAEYENSRLTNRDLQSQNQTRLRDLDVELAKPTVRESIDSFDKRMGRPGAFREECINRGASMWALYKKDMSPDQVVKDVLGLIGTPTGTPNQVVPTVANGGGATKPPVIPHVGSRPASPTTSRQIRSIEDLERIRKEKYGT